MPSERRTKERIAGALFDFLGFLTSREQAITVGAGNDAVPAVEALKEWKSLRGFEYHDADVLGWLQEDFGSAVRDDPDMTPEQKAKWLEIAGENH